METKRKGRSRGRRFLITGTASVLLVLLYIIIFSFSAQDSGESSSLSRTISEKSMELVNRVFRCGWSDARTAETAGYLEYPLRKIAHFSEYACMGVLVYVLWSQWMTRGRRLYFLTVLWVFFSAAGDELHQFFVPGRWASFWDVLLDTCGGIFGMFFCVAVGALLNRGRNVHGG